MLRKGESAPDFEGPTGGDEIFRLRDYKGKKNVVLYFYPKDFTPGCTREACTFRDNYPEVEQFDTIIVGISTDTPESHGMFRERYELPFPLVSDPQRKIVGLYKADGLLGLLTARVTYVIDKEGVVRAAFRHDFAIGRHWPEVLDALHSIQAAKATT